MVAFRPVENIKVCGVLVFCHRAGRDCSESRSTEDRLSRLECPCPRLSGSTVPPPPLFFFWLTDHLHVEPLSPWMTYTQPLSGAADVASLQPNTCWSGGAAGRVSIHSRRQVKARVLQASGRLWSSWPGEHNTTLLKKTFFFSLWLRQGKRTPEWESCRADSQWQQLIINKTRRTAYKEGHYIILGAYMMYTITRGPSKLVTQRRTGQWMGALIWSMMQCHITRFTLGRVKGKLGLV